MEEESLRTASLMAPPGDRHASRSNRMVLIMVERDGLLSWKRSPARSNMSTRFALANWSTSSNARNESSPRIGSRSRYPRWLSVDIRTFMTDSSFGADDGPAIFARDDFLGAGIGYWRNSETEFWPRMFSRLRGSLWSCSLTWTSVRRVQNHEKKTKQRVFAGAKAECPAYIAKSPNTRILYIEKKNHVKSWHSRVIELGITFVWSCQEWYCITCLCGNCPLKCHPRVQMK